MKKLKKVGFFKELSYGDSNGESIFELVNKGDSSIADTIYNYLKNGIILIVSPTVAIDEISKEKKEIGTLCIQTDGIWGWPSDLAYYVKHYNVLLPNEFLNNIFINNGVVNDNIDISLLTL